MPSSPMSNNLAWLCLLAATGVVSGRGVDPVLLNISPSRVCAGDTLNVSFTVRSPSSSLWAELWVDAKEGAAVPAYPVSRFRAHRGRFSVQTAEGRVDLDEELPVILCDQYDDPKCRPSPTEVTGTGLYGTEEEAAQVATGASSWGSLTFKFDVETTRPPVSGAEDIDQILAFQPAIDYGCRGEWLDASTLHIWIVPGTTDRARRDLLANRISISLRKRPLRELIPAILERDHTGAATLARLAVPWSLTGSAPIRIARAGSYQMRAFDELAGEHVAVAKVTVVECGIQTMVAAGGAGGVGDESGGMLAEGEAAAMPLPTYSIDGVIALDGTRGTKLPDHVLPPSYAAHNGSWSLTMWLYLADDSDVSGVARSDRATPTEHRTLFYKGPNPSDGHRTPSVWIQAGSRRMMLRASTHANNDAGKDSSSELPVRRWVHLAFTFRNQTTPDGLSAAIGASSWYSMKMFMDGKLDTAVEYNAKVLSNDGAFYLGKDPWMLGVRGLLARTAVYPRALTDAEVSQMVHSDRLGCFRHASVAPTANSPHGPIECDEPVLAALVDMTRLSTDVDPDAVSLRTYSFPISVGEEDPDDSTGVVTEDTTAGHKATTTAAVADDAADSTDDLIEGGNLARRRTPPPSILPPSTANALAAYAAHPGDAAGLVDAAHSIIDNGCPSLATASGESTADEARVVSMLEEAVEMRSPEGMFMLGLMKLRGHVCVDLDQTADTTAHLVARLRRESNVADSDMLHRGGLARVMSLFEGAARAGHGRAIWHYAVLLAGLGAQSSGSGGTPLSKSAAKDNSCNAAGLGAHSNTHHGNALVLPTNAARHDPVFGQEGSRKCAAKISRSDGQALRDAQVTAMYHISAMAGITEAQVALGYRYMVGRTVHPSCETAAWYLGAVAQQSHDEHHRGGAEQVQEMIRLTPDMENAADEGELGGDDERIAYQLLLAEQGNVPAMVNMGDLYYYGARGLARDQAAAFRWFDQAAAAGDANGQVAAAGLLLKGEGVDKNHTAALALYEKAADQNHTRALNGLAYLYFQGTDVERNFTRAFELFSRAAAKENDGDSLYNAGHCHQHGQGTTVNVAEAMRMFKIAAEKFGHFDSIFELSRLHLENAPTRAARSCTQAIRYLKPAAQHGSWVGTIRRGFNRFILRDHDGAALRYLEGAEMGYEVATNNVAYLFDRKFTGTSQVAIKSNPERHALRFYNQALESLQTEDSAAHSMDIARVHMRLGDYCLHGMGGRSVDVQQAILHYRRASAIGLAEAAWALGHVYEYYSRNLMRASRYYDRSIALTDNVEAKVALRLVLRRIDLKLWAMGQSTDADQPLDWFGTLVLWVAQNTVLKEGPMCIFGACANMTAAPPSQLGGPGAWEHVTDVFLSSVDVMAAVDTSLDTIAIAVLGALLIVVCGVILWRSWGTRRTSIPAALDNDADDGVDDNNAQPAQSAQPAQPTQPAQPAQPAQLARLVEAAIEPVEPVAAVGPPESKPNIGHLMTDLERQRVLDSVALTKSFMEQMISQMELHMGQQQAAEAKEADGADETEGETDTTRDSDASSGRSTRAYRGPGAGERRVV